MCEQIDVHLVAVTEVSQGIQSHLAFGLFARHLVAVETVRLEERILRFKFVHLYRELAHIVLDFALKAQTSLSQGFTIKFLHGHARTVHERAFLRYTRNRLIDDSDHLAIFHGSTGIFVIVATSCKENGREKDRPQTYFEILRLRNFIATLRMTQLVVFYECVLHFFLLLVEVEFTEPISVSGNSCIFNR